ncbi:dual specificity protein phosphatase PHS1 isoform X2, partial [Tanacetum coccineum]
DVIASQARVIHNCSPKWLKIKEAAEKARETTVSEANKVGEMTCSKLQEALECLYLMKNEDRLPCRYLKWCGNSANLLLADKIATLNHALDDAFF